MSVPLGRFTLFLSGKRESVTNLVEVQSIDGSEGVGGSLDGEPIEADVSGHLRIEEFAGSKAQEYSETFQGESSLRTGEWSGLKEDLSIFQFYGK